MDADVPSPSSPRSDGSSISPLTEGWTLVERPVAEDAPANTRPGLAEPAAELAAEQEEQLDGMKSPASERLADDLLREPFQAGGQLHMQLLAAPTAGAAAVEEPSTPTAPGGPYNGSCDNLALPYLHAHHPAHAHRNDAAAAAAALAAASALAAAGDEHGSGSGVAHGSESASGSAASQLCGWSFERHRERMRLRAATRLSGEGALEGFQDPQDLLLADAAPGASARIGGAGGGSGAGGAADDFDGAGGSGPTVTLGWESLVSGLYCDVVREWEDVRSLVTTTAAALWDKACDGHAALEKAVRRAAKTGVPLWALLGVSGLAAACLVALASQMCANRRLAAQVRQRESDLARLVVKILHLTDALNSAYRTVPAVPCFHTTCEHFTTRAALITMA